MKYVPVLACLVFFACSHIDEQETLQRAREAMAAGNNDEALRYYQMVYDEYPKSPSRAEVLYAMAAIHQNSRGEFATAIQLYRKLADEFPGDPRAPGALFIVGFIFHNELKMLDSARAAYEEFLRRYPSSEMVPSARFELANLGKEPGELIPPEPPPRVARGKEFRNRKKQ